MPNPFVQLWHWIFGKPTFRLTILFKSGNVIVADRVLDFHLKSQGNEVTYFRLEQHPRAQTRVLVPVLNLTQIEAVTRSP